MDERIGPSARLAELTKSIQLVGAASPFLDLLENSLLPKQAVARYLSDTGWAVSQFPHIIGELALRIPASAPGASLVIGSAREEQSHPRIFYETASRLYEEYGLGTYVESDAEAVTPLYRSLWEWIENTVRTATWWEGVAAAVVGVEATATAFEERFARIMRQQVSEAAVNWFILHSGPVEQAHGSAGVSLLAKGLSDDRPGTSLQQAIASVSFVGFTMNFAYPTALIHLHK